MFDRHSLRVVFAVALLLLASAAMRASISLFSVDATMDSVLVWSRTAIIAFLFTWWGVSVSQRIIARQTRRNLVLIAILAVFWLLVRSAKYYLVPATAFISHYLWFEERFVSTGLSNTFMTLIPRCTQKSRKMAKDDKKKSFGIARDILRESKAELARDAVESTAASAEASARGEMAERMHKKRIADGTAADYAAARNAIEDGGRFLGFLGRKLGKK